MPANLRKEQHDLPSESQRCTLKGNTIDTSSAVTGAGTAVSKAGGRSPPGPDLVWRSRGNGNFKESHRRTTRT